MKFETMDSYTEDHFFKWVDSGRCPREIYCFPNEMLERIKLWLSDKEEEDYYLDLGWPAFCEMVGYENLSDSHEGKGSRSYEKKWKQ